jgi:hypothetical protein
LTVLTVDGSGVRIADSGEGACAQSFREFCCTDFSAC